MSCPIRKIEYDLGFKIINGEKVPLSEEDRKKDRIYANSVISQFIPK